jgi:cell division septal protein FtsQ
MMIAGLNKELMPVLYNLDETEEMVVLLLRVEKERYKALMSMDIMRHRKCARKIRRLHMKIESLGGNTEAKIKVELPKDGESFG